jgi:hypothetical protein
VRRLAAVDMHGAHGTRRRRRIITAEFVLGAVVGVALGALVIAGSDTIGLRLFGAWLVGVCLNYVPLALYALVLLRPGGLKDELAGVDVRSELRHYTVAQLWIAVPLLFVVLALLQRGRE